MAAVLRPPVYHHQYSPRARPSILINTVPLSLGDATKRISNQSLSSSNSSSGNNTDDLSSSSTSQNLSQSWSVGHTHGTAALQALTAHTSAARSSSIPSRRIRFAPLPDPRALEDEEAAAEETDGTLVTSPDAIPKLKLDTSDALLSLPGSKCNSRQASPLGLRNTLGIPISDGALNESVVTLPDPFNHGEQITPTPSHTPTVTRGKSSGGWASKPKKLLKPFLRRSASPMPRSPGGGGFLSNISTEDILTLGTISLFRTSSRESRSGASTASSDDAGPSSGLSLGRWTSAGSYGAGSKARGREWFGSPLARTESTQSFKGDDARHRARTSSLSSNAARPAASAPASPKARTPRLKGTRMLNGRVYGGRRGAQNMNLFATAKDEEPEFVEWGYGGMGSVKAGKALGQDAAGTQWARVQGSGAVAGDDDDDGGGMGWVKKRKEARERAAREAEEKAKKEAAPPAADADPTPVEKDAAPEPEKPADEKPAPAPAPAPAPTTRPSTPRDEEHHIMRAVNVPAPAPSPSSPSHPHGRPHLQHLRTRSGSLTSGSIVSLPPSHPTTPDEPHARERAMSPLRLASFDMARDAKEADADAEKSGSGSGSGTTSEEEGEAGSEDEEEDEEEIRKTALGAGVEKISRHKDERAA